MSKASDFLEIQCFQIKVLITYSKCNPHVFSNRPNKELTGTQNIRKKL